MNQTINMNDVTTYDTPTDIQRLGHFDYLTEVAFYLILVPSALLANLVCADIVRRLLLHRRTMRRSIPDLCVGLLTFADLASLIFIHLVSLASMATAWNRLPTILCYYQVYITKY